MESVQKQKRMGAYIHFLRAHTLSECLFFSQRCSHASNMITDKQSVRRSQSEVTPSTYQPTYPGLTIATKLGGSPLNPGNYISRYPDEDDTQAKTNRQAMDKRMRLRRTLYLFVGFFAICCLTAWSAVGDRPAPIPHMATPLLFGRDGAFPVRLSKKANADPDTAAEEEAGDDVRQEDAKEVPPKPLGDVCGQCTLKGVCSAGGCKCLQAWMGPTCAMLSTVPRRTVTPFTTSKPTSSPFPIRDYQEGLYHLFLVQEDTLTGGSHIVHTMSSSPGSGYTRRSTPIRSLRSRLQDPCVVWLPLRELYVMYYVEVTCDEGIDLKTCHHSTARIRVASTSSISSSGKWATESAPILTRSTGGEDPQLRSPAAIVKADESVLLYYQGSKGIGLVTAKEWNAVYERHPRSPVWSSVPLSFFVWTVGGTYHLLGQVAPKSDPSAPLNSRHHALYYGFSADGKRWEVSTNQQTEGSKIDRTESASSLVTGWKAYGRPTLLLEDGIPKYLFTTVQSKTGKPYSISVPTGV